MEVRETVAQHWSRCGFPAVEVENDIPDSERVHR